MKLERTTTGIRLILGTTIREVGIPSPAHVAITRQGSNWFIWVNGSLADSFSTNYPIPRRSVTIGRVNTVLDEIRLTLAALYTSPFTPPEVPHQAWYQGNPIFARGQITQGIELIEGQIGGSEGSITEGSVLTNGQVEGSKGSITEGSVLPNAQVGGSEGQILQGRPTTPPTIIPSQRQFTKGSITKGSVLANGQVEGSKGSITSGSVIPFGIYPGQVEGFKGSIRQGEAQLFGHIWAKGQILRGDAPEPPPYIPPPPNIIPSQRQFAEGSFTFGRIILFDGTLIVPSQRQFSTGSIIQGRIDILGNPTLSNKSFGKQGSLLSDAGIVPWVNKQITGQGDRLPPYNGWDPSDIVRLMETLGIPITEDNLERVQERLNRIQALSPQGQKRIQSLLAHRDGLKLELTRTLQPVLYRITDGGLQPARGNPWKNRHRSQLIDKELRIVEKQIEVATGIPRRK